MKIRNAVRIAIINDINEVLLVHSLEKDYYHLPGGGANLTEETLEEAAVREALEETGINVSLNDDLGVYEEVSAEMINKSYGYLASIISENEKALNADEEDFENEWMSLSQANKRMEQSLKSNLGGKFEQFFARELEFITRAIDKLQ